MKQLYIILLSLLSQSAFSQNAINWEPVVTVAATHYSNQHPRVTTDASGNPLIVWGKTSTEKVNFCKGTPAGFTTPVVLNPTSIPAFTASWAGPDLAAHGDTVYVVFKHTPEDTNHIYVVHSFDAGNTFSLPVRVDYVADSISRFPTLTTDASGNPLVAFMKFNPGWTGSRYVVARSADFGNTFIKDAPASGFSGGTVCDCCPASLVGSGNTVAMVYRDNLNNLRDTWAGISKDGGLTFPIGMELDKTNWMINSCPASGPDGVIIGDSIYTVFMSAASGTAKCYFSKGSLTTLKSTPGTPLSNSGNYPRIGSSGIASGIVWVQPGSGNTSQLALSFTANVTKGFPQTYETVVPDYVTNADVALHNGAIYVVWEDDNAGTVKFRKGTYTPVTAVKNPVETYPFKLYPNPATDQDLTVEFDQKLSTQIDFEVSDAQGKLCFHNKGMTEAGRLRIRTTGLSAGSYFLHMKTNEGAYSVRFIKR
jgi:hypothetical protein